MRKSTPLRVEKRLRPVVPLGRNRVGPLPRNRVVPFRRNQVGPITRNPAVVGVFLPYAVEEARIDSHQPADRVQFPAPIRQGLG